MTAKEFSAPAVRIEQDNRSLFLTRFLAAELVSPGFYGVKAVDAVADKGYQREANEKRAKDFANYIRDAGVHALLPTSVFLATENRLNYDGRRISFTTSGKKSRPFFNMVDGQHRALGLGFAMKDPTASGVDKQRLREFPVAAVVVEQLGDIDQAVQFLVVNTTQKKVPKDVVQQIVAQFTEMDKVAEMPGLPRDLKALVESSVILKAINLVEYLNGTPGSPWQGKIKMANRPRGGETIDQDKFVDSLKTHVLTDGHPMVDEDDKDQRALMLQNYWRAVIAVFLKGVTDAKTSDATLFRNAGIWVFHPASKAVFRHLAKNGLRYTVENFRDCFQNAAAADAEVEEMTRGGWWEKGGDASDLTGTALTRYADALSQAVSSIRQEIDEGGWGEVEI